MLLNSPILAYEGLVRTFNKYTFKKEKEKKKKKKKKKKTLVENVEVQFKCSAIFCGIVSALIQSHGVIYMFRKACSTCGFVVSRQDVVIVAHADR